MAEIVPVVPKEKRATVESPVLILPLPLRLHERKRAGVRWVGSYFAAITRISTLYAGVASFDSTHARGGVLPFGTH